MATTTTAYTLDQYMSDKQKELERKKNAAINEANVSFEKLQKYLTPSEATARKGYSQGMSETAMIAADNSRQRAISAAENDYSAAYTDLLNQYRTDADAKYNEIRATIDSGKWNTVADLEHYINENSEGLTDFHKQQLQNELNYYKGNPDQQAADEKYYRTHNADGSLKAPQINIKDVDVSGGLTNKSEGNNFKINGYKLELGQLVTSRGLEAINQGSDKTSSVLPNDILEKTSDGQIFEYKGKLYYRSRFVNIDGHVIDRVFEVRGRGGKYDTDDYKNVLDFYINQ